jgi:hypothetical protein
MDDEQSEEEFPEPMEEEPEPEIASPEMEGVEGQVI